MLAADKKVSNVIYLNNFLSYHYRLHKKFGANMKKSMTVIASFVLLLTVTAQSEVLKFRMDEGRIVTAEHQVVAGAKNTVVLLPGINRSLEMNSEKEFFAAAKKYKINILAIATSSHPRSIAELNSDETAYFQSNTMTLKDYADEVEFVVKRLKIVKPYVASLSYSAAILSQLNSKIFAGYIEMVPMGDPVEGADAMTKLGRDNQDFLKLNPFMIGYVRAQRDSAYNSSWSSSVKQRLAQDENFYGPSPRVSDIVEGYASLARASEDFRLNRVRFEAPRHFILVDQEEKERFEFQITAVQNENHRLNGQNAFLLVGNSGHVLPSDQPLSTLKALTTIIDMITSKSFDSGVIAGEKFVEFTPQQKKELRIK